MQLQKRQDKINGFRVSKVNKSRIKPKSGFSPSCSVFQTIPWNWKHLTNRKVQRKKIFWHVILHSKCATLCVSFSSKSKVIKCFSKTYSEIKSTWSINSSKEELVLSRDSKELFVQRFMKVLIKIENMWRREIKEQAPEVTLQYCGKTIRSSHWGCCTRKLFLKFCNTHRKHLCLSLFLKMLQTFRPAN